MPFALVAGVVLASFGGLACWFLARRFPAARFMRIGYAVMSAGGLLCIAWATSKASWIGVAAAALVAVGGLLGAIGVLRKEVTLG